jgi:hypothetical protein
MKKGELSADSSSTGLIVSPSDEDRVDDEEWEYAKVRPATQQEIDTLSVICL